MSIWKRKKISKFELILISFIKYEDVVWDGFRKRRRFIELLRTNSKQNYFQRVEKDYSMKSKWEIMRIKNNRFMFLSNKLLEKHDCI